MKKTIAELNAMFEQEDELSLSDASLVKSTTSMFNHMNPETKAAHKLALSRDDVKSKMSDSLKITLNSEDVKKRHRAAIKNALAKPENKEKYRKSIAAAHAKPEVKANHIAATRNAMQRPEVQAKIRPQFSKEEKALYKKALKHGPMMNCRGKVSWLETARKFGLNEQKLAMYGRGQNLKDLT